MLNGSYRASFTTTTPIDPGKHTITAMYLGDNNFNTSAISPAESFNIDLPVSLIPGFDPPSVINKIYGDAPFQLPAVSGGLPDGGPYSYRSDTPGVAAVNATTGRITVGKVGEANIYVRQLASGVYPESPESAPVKVIVSRKPLTVTGITASKVFDGTNVFTNEQIDITGAVINGIVGSDVVTLSKSGVTGGTFGPGMGTGTLRITGSFSLGGADAIYYTLTPPTVTATIAGNSNTTVSDIMVDGRSAERGGNFFSIISPCGANSVEVNVSADPYATVSINGVRQNPYRVNLPKYGDNAIPIIVTAQNGNTATYTLTVHRSVPVPVAFYDRFTDVLTVPVRVAGIDEAITSVEWYHNGNRLDRDSGKGYLEMIEAGVYYALLNGSIRTCEVIKTDSRSATAMTVYPNPVERNQVISIEIDTPDGIELRDARLQLHGIDGRLLKTVPVAGNTIQIAAPDYKGFVVIKLISNSSNEEIKLIIK